MMDIDCDNFFLFRFPLFLTFCGMIGMRKEELGKVDSFVYKCRTKDWCDGFLTKVFGSSEVKNLIPCFCFFISNSSSVSSKILLPFTPQNKISISVTSFH